MARPRKNRRICAAPSDLIFNSNGKNGEAISMTVDEYETIRLIDFVGLTQQECAKQMQVARSTITSIYDNARYKISSSIVKDRPLTVEGGDFKLCKNAAHCCGKCGQNRCGRCKHGSCDRCIGIFREPGQECFVVHN